uniref:Translation initiation factor eIF-2B subunit gamma n=1 Tax=Mesocestoides corti TaxID=53468 RepID=A0A5K3F3X0_MESCO
MQVVILAQHDSICLRQLTTTGVIGQLPLASLGLVLSNLVQIFHSAGVTNPLILCRPGQTSQLEKCLPKSTGAIFIEISPSLSIPECLYRIRDRFTATGCCQYVFLTYADLVVTEFDIRRLFLKMVRTRAAIVALMAPYSTDPKFVKVARGGHDLMLIDTEDESLVMFTPVTDLKKQVRVPKSVVATHTHLVSRADLHDVGFYLLSGYALRLLEYNRDEIGLRKGFLKHIVNTEQYKPYQFDTSSIYISDLPEELRYSPDDLPKSAKVAIVIHQDKAVCRRLDSPLSYLDAVKLVR